MTKAELGTKRLCPNCGARYYDLNREPILCPRCGTEFEVVVVSRARPQAAAVKAPKPVVEEVAEDAVAVELVTLEEADEEAVEGGAVKVPGADEDVDEDEDDTFLPDDEEDEDEDVGDIIGDVDEEEP